MICARFSKILEKSESTSLHHSIWQIWKCHRCLNKACLIFLLYVWLMIVPSEIYQMLGNTKIYALQTRYWASYFNNFIVFITSIYYYYYKS